MTRTVTHRGRALLLALIAQNVATGSTLGTFGALMPGQAARLGASSAAVSLGLAFIMLMMGVLAPLAGAWVARGSIRNTMVLGATLLAAGFLILATTSHIGSFLGAYAVLIGPGVCFLGLVPATALVSNWYVTGRGRALGIATAPIGILLMPPLVTRLDSIYGSRVAYFALAVLAALTAALVLLVIDRPSAQAGEAHEARHQQEHLARSEERPERWPLIVSCLGLGLLIWPGTMALAHLIPLALSSSIAKPQAALLMSLLGGSGLIGALTFGWLADRLGPARVLVLNALMQAAIWTLMLLKLNFLLLTIGAFVLGACAGGIMGVFSALLIARFGARRFPSALGFASLLVVPFTFGAAPAAGLLVDTTGAYTAAAMLNIVALIAATSVFGASLRSAPDAHR